MKEVKKIISIVVAVFGMITISAEEYFRQNWGEERVEISAEEFDKEFKAREWCKPNHKRVDDEHVELVYGNFDDYNKLVKRIESKKESPEEIKAMIKRVRNAATNLKLTDAQKAALKKRAKDKQVSERMKEMGQN